MPSSCCCVGCTNRQVKDSKVKFFRIPEDKTLRRRWIAAIRRENWTPTEYTRICGQHFIKGHPVRDPTDPDYVPSIFCYTPVTKKSDSVIQNKVNRHQRLEERNQNKKRSVAAEALLNLARDDENTCPGFGVQTDFISTDSRSTQTDLTLPLLQRILRSNNIFKDQLEELQQERIQMLLDVNSKTTEINKLSEQLKELRVKLDEMEKLKEENSILMESVSRKGLSYGAIAGNDKKMKFYTGLPNCATFLVLFEEASPHAKRKNTKLDLKDELLLTLIKLRRNLAMEDLAYRFDTSISQVTKIFHRWLEALHVSIGGLVMWPVSDTMELPEVFQNERFQKVRCVIDCTEIFIDRPSALKARAQTYSNYKRHNTVKVLVGVSPTGAVVFLSKCWGGRVSDKQITLESGFLDKLLPGDVVLADRGFTMDEEFAFKGAKLIVPAFTKGKGQLSAREVEESRLMSRARIHVERVIGRLKDFEIIKGTLPITLIKSQTEGIEPTIDKIVRVIGAIVNMNDRLL